MEEKVVAEKKKRVNIDDFIYFREQNLSLYYQHMQYSFVGSVICLIGITFCILELVYIAITRHHSNEYLIAIGIMVVTYLIMNATVKGIEKQQESLEDEKPDRYDEYELSFRKKSVKQLVKSFDDQYEYLVSEPSKES